MGLFLESERIASRSSHSQGGHAYRHSSHMGISGLGLCLAMNVCALSVGTIPNSFWYNITSNTSHACGTSLSSSAYDFDYQEDLGRGGPRGNPARTGLDGGGSSESTRGHGKIYQAYYY
jgi:hypothetical protein